MRVAYVSKEVARSLRAGRLLTDFCLSPVAGGWQVKLSHIDGGVTALRATGSGESGLDDAVFETADLALSALFDIGFDVYAGGLGCWRPDPAIAEREHAKMRALFVQAIRGSRR
jgi:hypothetical protein